VSSPLEQGAFLIPTKVLFNFKEKQMPDPIRQLAEEIASLVLFLQEDGESTEEDYIEQIEGTLRNFEVKFPENPEHEK
jgi:hypothetical protein